MSERRVWEEKLWTSNHPLPHRSLPDPRVDLRGTYKVDGVWWTFWQLAPYEARWTGAEVEDGRWQAIYLTFNQVVRVALVDEHRQILDWRREAGSAAYRSRAPAPAPELHPLDRLHHRRRR